MVSSVINSKVLHITRFCFIQSILFHYGLIANHNTYILGNWIKETLDNAYNFPGTLPPVKPVNDMSRQRMLNLQFLSLNLNISYFTSQTDYKVGTRQSPQTYKEISYILQEYSSSVIDFLPYNSPGLWLAPQADILCVHPIGLSICLNFFLSPINTACPL